jgi:hypothetical protein
MMHPANYTGILLGAVAAWIFGAIYYTALSRPWLAAQDKTLEQCKAEQAAKPKLTLYLPFLLSFAGAVLMGVTLYGILTHVGKFTVPAGAISGAFCWLGFVLTTVTINNAYQGRRWSLTAIDAGHWLIALIIIGAIVGWMGP